ncbi:hypothetical protein [Streptomyces acidiscabies]|uniref:Integral membrane protein n=1 Tax=Streptomyces acidiscabies TaxID=42234 RepID=A0ABU4M8H0_9ACTN|nr:hypothetical protein [Streptomyces acidiscabies]MDX3024062.1 hypothetical protein [Streptomyces acidiscabies]
MNGSTRWHRAAGRIAEAAGRTVRLGPGLAGAGLVAYGVWLAWPPLGFVVLGAFLLLTDRRMP